MINIDLVKRLMSERNISQKMLADKMNLSEGFVSRILNGKRTNSLTFFEGLVRLFPEYDARSFLKIEYPDKDDQ